MLKNRLITGFSVGIFILLVLFLLPAWVHLILLLAIFALSQLEFYDMVKRSGHRYEAFTTSICGVLLLMASAIESPVFKDQFEELNFNGIMDLSAFVLCLTPALLLASGVFRRNTEKAMETFALSYAGFWYVAVLLSFLMRLTFEWNVYPDGRTNFTGRLLILLFVLIVKFSDIGAYTFGMLWGKHKLIPEISPKKTVEGLIGGYVGAFLISIICWGVAKGVNGAMLGEVHFRLAHAIILPLLLTTTGVIGDLAESLIKRSVNVKDSSNRFPGMGGILDILDSLLFSAPFMYIYLLVFMK